MKFGGKSVEDGDDLHKVYIGFSNPLDAVADLAYNELPAVKRESEQRDTRVTGGVAALDEARVVELIEEVVTPPPPLGYVPLVNNTVLGLPRTPVTTFDTEFWVGDGFAVDTNGVVEDWQNGARTALPVSGSTTFAALRNGTNFTFINASNAVTTNAISIYNGTTTTLHNYGHAVVAGQIGFLIYLVASRKAGVNGTYVITVDSAGTLTELGNYNAQLALGGLNPSGNWMARAGDDDWVVVRNGTGTLANGAALPGTIAVADNPVFNYGAPTAISLAAAVDFSAVGNGKLFYMNPPSTTLKVLDLATNAVTSYTNVITNLGVGGDTLTMGWAGGNYVVINWQDSATNPQTQAGYKVTNGVLESDNTFTNWVETSQTTEVVLRSRWDGAMFVALYSNDGTNLWDTLNGYSF